MLIGISILVLAFSIWLTCTFLNRKKKEGGNVGCIAYGFVFLVILAMTSITSVAIGVASQKLYNHFSLPEYEAVVIEHYVYESKSTGKTGTGSYHTRIQTMYQPIVRFRDATGQEREILIDVASSKAREIGSKMMIGYKPAMETAQEKSIKNILLQMGGGFVGLVCGYFLLVGVFYALGKDTSKIWNFGAKVFTKFILPMALFGFLGVFLYKLYEHFMGIEILSMWVVILLTLFSVALLPVCLLYIFPKKINRE